MILAKNYETVSKFVKVMPRILSPLFSPDTVYMHTYTFNRRLETFYSVNVVNYRSQLILCNDFTV